MKEIERLKYIVHQGDFKYCEIKTKFGENIVNYDCKSHEQLSKHISQFIDTWGHTEYKIVFKTSQSNRNDLSTVLHFNFSDQKPQEKQLNLNSAPIQNTNFNPKQFEDEIILRVRAEMKSKELSEREIKISAKEKELDTAAGKFNYVLNSHILPHFMGGTPGQAPPINSPVLQGTNEIMQPFLYEDPRNKPKILDIKTDEPQDENNKKYEIALKLLCECIDAETLLLFAQKIKKEPGLINTLKMML
jgi:hypothetical protein